MVKKRRSKSRIIRAIGLLVAAFLAYTLVGGYAPFRRCPELKDPAAIEAKADEMQVDIRSPDRAMLLHTHSDALDERIRLMYQARRDLVIAAYDCRDGESTRDVLAVALERADAGVRVRMLVDGISGWLRLSSNPLFLALEAHENIEIRFYNPVRLLMPWHLMGRMHDKYVIVDDTACILGGRNMFDSFIGDYPADVLKDDREVLVWNSDTAGKNSFIYELWAYFEGIWDSNAVRGFIGRDLTASGRGEIYGDLRDRCEALRSRKPQLFKAADYTSMTVPTKGVWLISNPTECYAKQPVVYSTLCALMRRAKSHIVIHSPYAVLNDGMAAALTDIASTTPLTLMVNAVEHSHNVMASSDYIHHRSDVLATGVDLLEYAGDNYYHGKAVLIDDCLSIIGCYNLDLRSTYVDTELMLVIRGEEINAQLRQSMDALHADCRRVTGEDADEGPNIPPLPLWKRLSLWALGGVMQLFRNIL